MLFPPVDLVEFNQVESNLEVLGIMNAMYDEITIELIIIIPQTGINDSKKLPGTFNPKDTGITRIIATKARLE